jgi:Putative prokaryotic signal transducing protein
MPDTMNPVPQPDPNEKLVKVFDAEQESEAIVVRGLLESAGIETDLKAIDAVQDAFPIGGMMILVREEDASEAGKIIESYRQSPPLDDDDATAEISG